MRIKKTIQVWGWLLFLPLLGGCAASDDLQGIFTGDSWKMTYISQGNGGAWYKFPDVSESNYKQYDPQTGTKSFTLTFTGVETDEKITGTFEGKGAVTMSGSWGANNDGNTFHCSYTNGNVIDRNDKLGNKIKEMLAKVDSYSGDERNLFLHFTYEKDRIFMAFTRVKKQ